VVLREAEERDLPGVLAVQRDAFGRVARQLSVDPADLPPLQETLADMARLRSGGTRFFVAVDTHGTVIGSVRGTDRDGVVDVGRLVVASDWIRQGIATRLMSLLESSYQGANGFVLFTGVDAVEALALYRKIGYSVTHEDHTGAVPLVWLDKRESGLR